MRAMKEDMEASVDSMVFMYRAFGLTRFQPIDDLLDSFKTGTLTDEEAVFYLACLFLQDSRYFQLGGPDVNGKDMTSNISYLCLDAADKIKEFAPQASYSSVPSVKSHDVYVALFKNEGGKNCAMYFVATAQALRLLHFHNSRTQVTKTEV